VAQSFDDISVDLREHVATVEIKRAPNNYFDAILIRNLAHVFESLDKLDQCRTIVLASEGKSFCAGADFANKPDTGTNTESDNPRDKQLYKEAVRLFRTAKPIVAAVHGPAIGGGLGLACVADFRVTCKEARFSANFTRLGLHPGFGLSVTLPALIGQQRAALMFYTGRRIDGEIAFNWGLADIIAPFDQVRAAALALAAEIGSAAPLAVQSTRQTLRLELANKVERATERELVEQEWLRRTIDFTEGVEAAFVRREPNFRMG